MSKSFSIYLDLLRFIAACLVYQSHANQRLLVSTVPPASSFGHSSVIVFFVLSGYVISWISASREKNLASYAASRLSRIYSVAVPAIILSILLDAAGRQLYPELYTYPFSKFFTRSASSLLMLNEVWFLSIISFSNIPFWSICYESWYYLAFGLLTFLRRRHAVFFVAALAMLLGPKILLLAPVWAAGVVLYRWKALQALSEFQAWLLVLASVCGIIAFHQADMTNLLAYHLRSMIGYKPYIDLAYSKFFLSDYMLASLVFCNFAGMRRVCARLEPALLLIERPVRFLASYTFTLYLLHQPLLLFWGAVIHGNPGAYGYWGMITTMVALSVLLLGHVTENRRHLLKHWLEQGFIRMGRSVIEKAHVYKH